MAFLINSHAKDIINLKLTKSFFLIGGSSSLIKCIIIEIIPEIIKVASVTFKKSSMIEYPNSTLFSMICLANNLIKTNN